MRPLAYRGKDLFIQVGEIKDQDVGAELPDMGLHIGVRLDAMNRAGKTRQEVFEAWLNNRHDIQHVPSLGCPGKGTGPKEMAQAILSRPAAYDLKPHELELIKRQCFELADGSLRAAPDDQVQIFRLQRAGWPHDKHVALT